MKKEKSKQFIHWCTLGAIGGIFMAAGDWLLGCVPLQKTDTGMSTEPVICPAPTPCGSLHWSSEWERLGASSTPSW